MALKKSLRVAVVGATGMVGRTMVRVLEERHFPTSGLVLLASAKSKGVRLPFAGGEVPVEELTPGGFRGVDVALFSAGAAVSREFAPHAVKAGALVIDNSSAFRMDADVPLIVPEVNPGAISRHRGIIANPNCSTIQMVVALKPLHDRWKIRRIVVATYQSVTGAGKRGVSQLEYELGTGGESTQKFPHRIAYNILPQIDVFLEEGYTREELKMLHETQKIMEDPSIAVTATCVRVPVIGGHSEAVNAEFERPFRLEEVRSALAGAPGVSLVDEPERSIYPMPVDAYGKDAVFVGRIRRDTTVPNGLNLWVVADNLRKGAATNAVQIAEWWAEHND
ncbi:MAG TPA: aspartate-semialdehyde dehydrogenase [Bacteroidota bacterium]|nr:aspartate-semialdehyde dehydrogenase [Bacteroidota bacterium]